MNSQEFVCIFYFVSCKTKIKIFCNFVHEVNSVSNLLTVVFKKQGISKSYKQKLVFLRFFHLMFVSLFDSTYPFFILFVYSFGYFSIV